MYARAELVPKKSSKEGNQRIGSIAIEKMWVFLGEESQGQDLIFRAFPGIKLLMA